MVDTMAVLAAAAYAKLTGDRIVRNVVADIRESCVTASESTAKTSRHRHKKNRLSRPFKSSTSGLGPRPSSSRRSKKVSLMTDAELEAELEERRRRRAKERDLYSRALRSEKLAALESELANLRREIGRIDPVSTKSILRSGKRHSVRWEPLPKSHRSTGTRPPSASATAAVGPSAPVDSCPPPSSGPAPPPPPTPPPPPPPLGASEDKALTLDPEKQKREKQERQRRREAKKKEREQTQKKMTLADIIRSAGADPMKRLKPAGKKLADIEKEEYEKQKREREEREMRQEQERIELEKKAIENMGRTVTEECTTTKKNSKETDDAQDPPQSPGRHPSEGVKTLKKKASSGREKESSKLDGAPTLSKKPNEVKENESDSYRHMDKVQTCEMRGTKEMKNSKSSEKQPLRSAEIQEDISNSSTMSDVSNQICETVDENKNSRTPENCVVALEGNTVEDVLQNSGVSKVTRVDTENISPNASTTNPAAGNKIVPKSLEETDGGISCQSKLGN